MFLFIKVTLLCVLFAFLPTYANSAIVFDYLIVCDSCNEPKEVVIGSVPDFSNKHSDTYANEYSVLVVEPQRNEFHFYKVFTEESGKYAFKQPVSGYQLDLANQALSFYRAKGQLIHKLNRDPMPVLEKLKQSKLLTEFDCTNPGVVFNIDACSSAYLWDLKNNVFTNEVEQLVEKLESLEPELTNRVGHTAADSLYRRSTDIAYYKQEDGANVAFKLNQNLTGLLAVATIESSFNNGATLSYYLSRDHIYNTNQPGAQRYLDALGCKLAAGDSFNDQTRYNLKRLENRVEINNKKGGKTLIAAGCNSLAN